MFKKRLLLVGLSSLLFSKVAYSQEENRVPQGVLSLDQVVEFALLQSPIIRQAQIDQEIGERDIKSNLANWYPQITASAAGAYNIKLQQQIIGDQLITFGQKYNSNVLLQANQTLFNRDQLFASKSSRYYRQQLQQVIEDARINTVVDVSKAFYSILLSEEQINILDQNLNRLEKQYKDAFSRFEAGLVDKTDYQRASIALTNVKSDRNRVTNSFDAKYDYLKQLMGYPDSLNFTIEFDTQGAEGAIGEEVVDPLMLENRVEYQLLQTQQTLNEIETSYEKWNYLPELSAYYRYNLNYFNSTLNSLYKAQYPISSVGVNLTIPIFQGGKRIHKVKAAELRVDRGTIEIENLSNQIRTEYSTALAAYNSSVYEWQLIRENMEMAEEVYNIIKLQYDEGIKSYIELVIAETDLQTAQINHINAFYQVLQDKLDLRKALGTIN
ncbi:outer membrane protein TolC [Algoriphagus ratkowskyi]|uniref:Outer membrane protein TolC n=1 Tax=Algoriphagus ratkowskyi TaxID=57028 RepID=A0A2W7R4B2_9BACT|nr:TolC family protein [Algoriphagus ratkowskyi]PZX53120.1 outer membrane protein TolC [Algoriphagus ratkowskyi]TXD76398.1 TolC family protein [Algoriphagus ratkowskyi]